MIAKTGMAASMTGMSGGARLAQVRHQGSRRVTILTKAPYIYPGIACQSTGQNVCRIRSRILEETYHSHG